MRLSPTNAKYHFGGEQDALLALEAMGLTSSEHLGQILFTMVDAGVLRATPKDQLSDFENLFTLDTLFAAARPVEPDGPADPR